MEEQKNKEIEISSKWLGGSIAVFMLIITIGVTTFAVSIFEGPINFGKAPT